MGLIQDLNDLRDLHHQSHGDWRTHYRLVCTTCAIHHEKHGAGDRTHWIESADWPCTTFTRLTHILDRLAEEHAAKAAQKTQPGA